VVNVHNFLAIFSKFFGHILTYMAYFQNFQIFCAYLLISSAYFQKKFGHIFKISKNFWTFSKFEKIFWAHFLYFGHIFKIIFSKFFKISDIFGTFSKLNIFKIVGKCANFWGIAYFKIFLIFSKFFWKLKIFGHIQNWKVY
jgi:hypothetical protein